MSKIVANQISPRSGDTVSFSSNISGTTGTFTGNVSVGGTLSYEDVTNVDAVGVVTARTGINVGTPGASTATINADGDVTMRDLTVRTVTSSDQIISNRSGTSVCFRAQSSGVDKFIVKADGKVGIGTDNPAVDLGIRNTGFAALDIQSDRTSGTIGGIRFLNAAGASRANIYGLVDEQLQFQTAGEESFRVDSSGRLLVGGTSTHTTGDVNSQLQVEGTSFHTSSLSLIANSTSGGVLPHLSLAKSKGSSVGSNTIVVDSETLGSIQFCGADGTDLNCVAASINGVVDGTPGVDDMPGRIQFHTTDVGAAAPTEKARIDTKGRFLIGHTSGVSGTDNNGRLQVSQDIGSNACVLVVENLASSGNISVIRSRMRNQAPDNIFSAFLQCDDSSTNRATIRANGGLANYSANNANLSDRNTKKDITPAADTWNSIKNWEIVNFRYNEQPDDADKNLGVIAQQIEEISPEMVTIFQEAKEATETEPAQEQRLGVREQQMQWMGIKALQEAMARIEELEAKVAALEGS